MGNRRTPGGPAGPTAEAVVNALKQGATSLSAAAQQAGIQRGTAQYWYSQDAQFRADVDYARRLSTGGSLLIFLRAVRKGSSLTAAAAASGRSYKWILDQARVNPVFDRLLNRCRELAAADREPARPDMHYVDALHRQRELQYKRRQQDRADQVIADRRHLDRLYPLVEGGMLLRDALRRIGKTVGWLSGARRRVPEASQRLERAARAGRAARPRPLTHRTPALLSRDDTARHLIVAELAKGARLKEAAKAGGAVPAWVANQYHRRDDFRVAVNAVVAMYPDYDFAEDLKRHDQGGAVPAPRPPKPPE